MVSPHGTEEGAGTLCHLESLAGALESPCPSCLHNPMPRLRPSLTATRGHWWHAVAPPGGPASCPKPARRTWLCWGLGLPKAVRCVPASHAGCP